MSPSTKPFIFQTLLLLLASFIWGGDNFPDWGDELNFRSDLRKSALITNLPNPTGEDYFIGFRAAVGGFYSESSETQTMPGARISIYPSPGYNIWTQFSKWSGEQPAFSVGTGVQVEFPAEDIRTRQAIGLTWNEVYGTQYTQRDISVHALLGRSGKSLGYGVIAVFNMQHTLVESGHDVTNFDESFIQGVPYINWMFGKTTRVSLKLPVDVEGVALDVSFEWLWGKRE